MIYLDYNATTPLNSAAQQKLIELITENHPLNPSSAHHYGRQAKKILFNSRAAILSSLSLNDKYEIVFTSSGTEANNQIISTFQNSPIYYGSTDHKSVTKIASHHKGISVPVHNNGYIDTDWLRATLSLVKAPFLVSICHANNETGVINPIEEIVQIVHKYGGLIHSDLSQSIGKTNFNIQESDLDYATISSHKIGGPLGTSAIIYKKQLLLNPLLLGGGQEFSLRSGTENIIAIAAFANALQTSTQETYHYINHTSTLQQKLEQEISSLGGHIVAKEVRRLPNTSLIASPTKNYNAQLIEFDMHNIMISNGSACSSGKIENSHVLLAMQLSNPIIQNVIRISTSLQTTPEEIDIFIKTWRTINIK